jgi:hypothetical protein
MPLLRLAKDPTKALDSSRLGDTSTSLYFLFAMTLLLVPQNHMHFPAD